VTLPGGPACLAGHPQAYLEEQGIVDELKFLVEVHRLKRVVLLAHQSCAFYSNRLTLQEPRLELVQRADLVNVQAGVFSDLLMQVGQLVVNRFELFVDKLLKLRRFFTQGVVAQRRDLFAFGLGLFDKGHNPLDILV
jgi:hypothetical protein